MVLKERSQMKVWHAVNTYEGRGCLFGEMEIRLGRNVCTDVPLAHVSVVPFQPGNYALDVICGGTNEAWVFELEIDDATVLERDPSHDDQYYGGGWKVSRTPIRIKRVLSERHIVRVDLWEAGVDDRWDDWKV